MGKWFVTNVKVLYVITTQDNMRKTAFIVWLVAGFACVVLFLCYNSIITNTAQNKIITQQSKDIANLSLQNMRLLDATTFLAEKMTNMADVITQKAEWDKKVAERLREQEQFNRTAAQLLTGYTNETKSIP
jgi:ABC-type protease/lipase transport system fused ATPase/permease subunit